MNISVDGIRLSYKINELNLNGKLPEIYTIL